MSVDIKIASVDEIIVFGERYFETIIKLKLLKSIFKTFRFLRLWLYPIITIIKVTIYLLMSPIRAKSNS